MAEKAEIRREAKERQGTVIVSRRGRYFIEGDQRRARFQSGAEGLVQPAIEEGTGKKYRIKVFWDPDESRLARSRALVHRALARPESSLDVLGGAPFAILDSLGGSSRFAVIMKNIEGVSWKDLRRDAEFAGVYPPPDWPSFRTRWLWAYGLVTAVAKMETLNFIHADLSDGNLVGLHTGNRAGELALVDFDAYFNPDYPSNYLGTSGFVAPEIWSQSAIGVGSDRLAMAILIQEFLLVGDHELNATDAFQIHYTQEQICALECTAHPLLRLKYPAIANLFDRTLKAPSRNLRPEPMEWRETLRTLRRTGPVVVHLTPPTGGPDLPIELRPGEFKDLAPTLFGIHADLVLHESLCVRPHPGSHVLLRPVDGTWKELADSSDVEISPNSRLFDRAGKMQAQVVVDAAPEDATDPQSQTDLRSYDQTVDDSAPSVNGINRKRLTKIKWNKVALSVAILCIVFILIWAFVHLKRRQFRSLTSSTDTSVPNQSTSPVTGPQSAQHLPTEDAAPQTSDPVQDSATPQQISPPSEVPPPVSKPGTEPDSVELPPTPSETPSDPAGPDGSKLAAGVPQVEPPKAPIEPNVYRGPPSGDFVWSGTVEKNQLIEIANGSPSIGSINGQPLPGVPVSISIVDAQIAVVAQPNPLNHFSTVVFRSTTKGKIAFGVHWVVLPIN